MEVVFLGGASGVGASCVAVAMGGRWLLVDAGVRVGGNSDRLPDLAFLDGKDLAAVLVTHAHADHIGALPLVAQAFPRAPLYASAATCRLMEVMLADSLNIMGRRAVEELEIPLYNDVQVAETLKRLRPLPMGGVIAIPELPGLKVHTSIAGHIAGALMLGLDHPEGRVVISGDVSVTPQRTVPAAKLPGLRRPDLLVLESTYGARLHASRPAEELRLGQAVAAGVAKGGHVLIPAFALGRAQEVLLILQDLQERGDIPSFPIYVDGLARTVCAAYTSFPQALNPALRRRIERGQPLFFGGNVRSVTSPAERAGVITGPPACIVASSGMLTGGPSAAYAAAMAPHEQHTILITGYQDEESPGRALLDLAERGSGTLNVGGLQVQVRCHVARYGLSAHADGGELAAIAATLDPDEVALVHGDPEARAALAQRLGARLVQCPADGTSITVRSSRARRPAPKGPPEGAAAQPGWGGLGQGRALSAGDLPGLALRLRKELPGAERVVSAREVALLWHGLDAVPEQEAQVAAVLSAAPRPFIPVPAAPGLYIVGDPDPGAVQAGDMVLARFAGDALLPFLITGQRGNVFNGVLPEGKGYRDRIGPAQVVFVVARGLADLAADPMALRAALAGIFAQAKALRRRAAPAAVARALAASPAADLDGILAALGLPASDPAARLAVALAATREPRLLTIDGGGGPARLRLAEGWQAALAAGAGNERPDSAALQQAIDRHLPGAADLYRRSIDPESGAITLAFHFPEVARARHAAALAALADETGVSVELAPRPHQGALIDAARAAVAPAEVVGNPAIHLDARRVAATLSWPLPPEAAAAARARFAEATGWALELRSAGGPSLAPQPAPAAPAAGRRMTDHEAIAEARRRLGAAAVKVGAQAGLGRLLVRFPLPQADAPRHAATLAEIAEATGWAVDVHPEPQQAALLAALEAALGGAIWSATPSLYPARREVAVRLSTPLDGEALAAAQARFAEVTGWGLILAR